VRRLHGLYSTSGIHSGKVPGYGLVRGRRPTGVTRVIFFDVIYYNIM
jgi:hypothetical protein